MENEQKALIYCRVSSPRQKLEGHGLESQRYRCEQYANGRHYIVEKVFQDDYTGGGDFWNRPAMHQLLDYLDKKAYKGGYVVIFDDLKRFARDLEFHWKLRTALKSLGATVECLNFTFDESDEGWYSESVMATHNEYERRTNRRQVLQKMKARLEAGYWPFCNPPGYKFVRTAGHGKLLTSDELAPIVKEAFEGFASGKFRDQVDVQKFLQKNKFYGDRPIYPETVKRLFTRPIYAGYIEYSPWEVSIRRGHHQAIISLELFQRVQDKLNGKARSFSRKDTRPDFPLRGPVVCAGCMRPLTASWSTSETKAKHPYYRCISNNCPIKNKSIRKNTIETSFGDLLKQARAKNEVIDYAKALFMQRWENKLSDLGQVNATREKELSNVIAEKSVILARIPKVKSEPMLEVYEKQVEALYQKELALKEPVGPKSREVAFGTALKEVMDVISNPYKKWQSELLEDKRLVLKLVFTDKIAYHYKYGFGTANYSLPVKAFEVLAVSKSQGVDPGRIELPCGKKTAQRLQGYSVWCGTRIKTDKIN